jgi:membrane-associated protease RseP (regulator of RpoE activity)
MIKLKLKNINIVFRFTFFAVAAIFLLFRDNEIAIMGIAASLIHEFGHIATMKMLGIKLNAVEFYLLGIKISKSKTQILSYNKEFLILIAGITANLTISAILLLFGNPELQTFGMVNAAIGFFNLLPFKMFDGGQIKELLIERYSKDLENSERLNALLKGITIIIAAVAFFILLINKNITAAIVLLFFLMFEIFDER